MSNVNNVDKRLKVESFQHWVWVAGVDETQTPAIDGVPCYKVEYTGDNIPGVDDKTIVNYQYWSKYDDNAQRDSDKTYLPWVEYGAELASDGSYKTSCTGLVWNWEAYYYRLNSPTYQQMPYAKTRYYDGSG